MNSQLFAQEVEMLLKKAIEASDTFMEDDYGRAIRLCCGAEVFNNNPHEPDCWLVKAQKLLGITQNYSTPPIAAINEDYNAP